MDLVNKFLLDFREFYPPLEGLPPMLQIRPRAVCKDGFHVSIQASHTHYCLPRDNDGPYSEVELGYPSADPTEDIKPYAEHWDDEEPDYTGTVYGYVPVKLVVKMLEEHGGIVGTKRAGSDVVKYPRDTA